MSYSYDEITTTDLSKFGARELMEAADLLTAYAEGVRPHDFDPNGVTVMFNSHSGKVFLANKDFHVAVSDGRGGLASFYTSPHDGHEGTLEHLCAEFVRDDWDAEDIEWLEDLHANAEADLSPVLPY